MIAWQVSDAEEQATHQAVHHIHIAAFSCFHVNDGTRDQGLTIQVVCEQ
mgnify:CR=1 FL=1